MPTFFDVAGGAHWGNKMDNIITVHRTDKTDPRSPVQIHVQKVRFKHIGEVGGTWLRPGKWTLPRLGASGARASLRRGGCSDAGLSHRMTFTPCPRPIDAPPIRLTIINTQTPGLECAAAQAIRLTPQS